MSDYGNILYFLEGSKKAWADKDYLNAAINAFWCIQYCEHGEPYGISFEELHSSESHAYSIYRKATKKFKSSILSKTTFIYGIICPKLLWLYKYKYNLRNVSEQIQKKFNVGHSIGYLAQNLFPDGVDASAFDSERIIDMSQISLPFNLKQQLWIGQTQKFYKDNTVYEAAFTYNDVFTAVDILRKTDSGYIAYEVKSSKSITDTLLKDCALQYYVTCRNCKLDDFFLIYINEDYIKQVQIPLEAMNTSNIDINKLFIFESVLSKILPLQSFIFENIKTFKDILKKGEPIVKMGQQCNSPYECMFKRYCNCDETYEEFGIY